MPDSKLDLLQGTLDLMVLQTLDTMGPLRAGEVDRARAWGQRLAASYPAPTR